MKTVAKLTILSCYFLSLFSCRKFDSHYFQGTVTDKTTGMPVPNAVIVLQYWNYAGKGNYIYDSTYSNQSGNYVFNHRKHRGWSYRMWAKCNGYYSNGYFDLTRINPKPPYNFQLTPKKPAI